MVRRRALVGAALAAPMAAPMLARHGWAQSNDWPKGPVRWVVAYAAGGAADTVARNIGARVADILGQQVIIENRTGGNSLVAETAVLQAPKDGQTFLVDAANQLTNEFLIKDIPFNYEKTWLPVSLLSLFPQVVAVKDEFPAKTIQEYIAAAEAKPDSVSYGTPPAAGMAHMAGEELQRRAGIKLIHTPYRGGADAARDIGAGAVDSVIITTSSIRPPLANKKARVLAVTSQKRAVTFPNVPTLAESGYPGFDMNDWNGLFAAEGVPQPIIQRMQQVVAEACKDAKVKERLDPSGAELVANTPAEFGAWLKTQRVLLGQLIKDANIKLG
jgi:tripartite-type tricarboxylate transporter receptor subunit TctC